MCTKFSQVNQANQSNAVGAADLAGILLEPEALIGFPDAHACASQAVVPYDEEQLKESGYPEANQHAQQNEEILHVAKAVGNVGRHSCNPWNEGALWGMEGKAIKLIQHHGRVAMRHKRSLQVSSLVSQLLQG